MSRPPWSGVGIGGWPGPTEPSPLERRIDSASSATGRVTTIFTSASESRPPQFRRAQARRSGRSGRAQRAHVGAACEGWYPLHAAARNAAADTSRKAAVSGSDHQRHARRARSRGKAGPLAGWGRWLARDLIRGAGRRDHARGHLEATARDGAASRTKSRDRARLPPDRHARPERARKWRVRYRLSPALARVRSRRGARHRRGVTGPRARGRLCVLDDASGDLPVLRVVDRYRMAPEEDLLQRPAGARAQSDLGLRACESPRADVRVRASDGGSRQRLRSRGPDRRWALGMVAAPRWRAGGLRRPP